MRKLIRVKTEFYRTIIGKMDLILTNDKLNYFIGKNGVGKSNILSSINYLNEGSSDERDVRPLIKTNSSEFDENNTFVKLEIDNDSWYQVNNSNRNFLISSHKLSEFIESKFELEYLDIPNFVKITKGVTQPMFKKLTIENNFSNFDEIENTWKKITVEAYSDLLDNNQSLVQAKLEKLESFFSEEEVNKFKEYQKVINAVSEFFFFQKKLQIKYINDFDEIIKHGLTYNIRSSSIFSEEYISREEINENLELILNFLFAICPENSNIQTKIANYLDKVSIDNIDNDDEGKFENLTLEITNLKDEIERTINTSVEKFFEDNFSDDFEFKLKLTLDKEKMTFSVLPRNEYRFDIQKIASASDGTRSLINYVIAIESMIYRSQFKEILLLLDEPEKNMYPSLQTKFVKYLESKLKTGKIFIAITTHHTSMISEKDFVLNIVSRNEEGETKNEVSFGECNYIDKKCDSIKKSTINTFIENIINSNNSFEQIINSKKH